MEISKIEKKAKDYGIPIIRSESHKFLQQVTQKEKPKHILEIGTAVGYSGIAMLETCDADLVTIEHNHDFIKQANKNFKEHGLSKRVQIIEGDCMVEIAKMVASESFDEYFDMIFLDGPKAQYDLLLKSLLILLKPNGIFIADNVLFRGYVQDETKAPSKRYKTIIKRLNEFIENCKNNPNFKKFELKNIEDGIIFAKKASRWKINKSNF